MMCLTLTIVDQSPSMASTFRTHSVDADVGISHLGTLTTGCCGSTSPMWSLLASHSQPSFDHQHEDSSCMIPGSCSSTSLATRLKYVNSIWSNVQQHCRPRSPPLLWHQITGSTTALMFNANELSCTQTRSVGRCPWERSHSPQTTIRW